MELAAIPPDNSIEHIEIFIQVGVAFTRAIPDVEASDPVTAEEVCIHFDESK